MSRTFEEEEAELGYWHYIYSIEEYYAKTIAGHKKDTKGWNLSDYARAWSNEDIVGYSVFMEDEWSGHFREGVISAHKVFMRAILDYDISQDLRYYDRLRVGFNS